MNGPAGRIDGRALHATRERVARLLSRYPEVTDDDVAEIVEFLRTGRHLDIGLLTADDALRPRLDAFMAAHKAELRPKLGEAAVIAALIAGFLFACWLLWSSA